MRVYLDNNTTTIVDPQVKTAMDPFFSQYYGNPSSAHLFASDTHMDLDAAFKKIYAGINAAKSDHIIITSGQSESNSWIFNSIFFEYIMTGRKDHIIVSEMEHPSVIKSAQFLESLGVKVTYISLNSEGLINASDIKACITAKTALVSVSWVNHLSGAISPIETIAQICRERDIHFHSDASYAIGKVKINMQAFKGIDYLTFSSSLFHGPKGIGALFMKEQRELRPMIHGEEMGGYRGDTLNVAGIVGMGKAMELCVDSIDFDMPDIEELRDELEDELLKIENSTVIVPREQRVENTTMISFEGVSSDSLVWELSQKEIAVSKDDANVIFCLSRYTTKQEIDYTVETTRTSVSKLRKISGYKGE